MKNIFFNAHHAPIGAYSSFTLGFKGKSGGLAAEYGKPADQNVYIGLQSIEGDFYECFPFFKQAEDQLKRFGITDISQGKENILVAFDDEKISRTYSLTKDVWKAQDIEFAVYSPVRPIPEPTGPNHEEMKDILIPAVFVEITIDNRECNKSRRAFFGYEGNDPYYTNHGMRILGNDPDNKAIGVGQGRFTAIAAAKGKVKPAIAFNMEDMLVCKDEGNWLFGLGGCAALIMDVQAGKKETLILPKAVVHRK